MKRVYSVLVALVFGGCSLDQRPNDWEYKSTRYFEAYKNDFLHDKALLAQADLSSAVNYAKRGADFSQLASIYLGKCALNIAVGIEDGCKEYLELQDQLDTPKFDNYYRFIQKDFAQLDRAMVDEKYEDFIQALQKGDHAGANKAIEKMEDPVSKLLALALFEDATKETIEHTIETLSFYGYKKGVITLLHRLETRTTDPKEKGQLHKKIELLR